MTWYTAHQAAVRGWALPFVLLAGAGMFALLSIGIHFLFRRARTEGEERIACSDTWLHDIAEEQAKAFQDYVEMGCHIDGHKLTGDNPYINFIFQPTNRSVYTITVIDDLSGPLYFGGHRLTNAPTLIENAAKKVGQNTTLVLTELKEPNYQETL